MPNHPSRNFGFSLLWFYGIKTIVGYAMLNPVFIYILNLPSWWDYRIFWLLHCGGLSTPLPNEYPVYDTKQSDGEVPEILEYFSVAITSKSTLAQSGSTW